MSPSEMTDPPDTYAESIRRLKHITRHADEGRTIRIENFIGFTSVPVGLAGPLQILGHHQKSKVTAPFATVEATLIASVNRGCKAFQQCGGVKAYAMSEGMGRAPVFRFATVDDAVIFCESLPTLEGQLREDAEKTSRFARLVRLTPHIIGTKVHLHFEYTCGDAAGQNMVRYCCYTVICVLMVVDRVCYLHGLFEAFSIAPGREVSHYRHVSRRPTVS